MSEKKGEGDSGGFGAFWDGVGKEIIKYMETRELAALSQIAEILSNNNKSPLIPSEDIWKKIFCGAELEDLYEERLPQFRIESRGYGSDREYYFNDKTYNGLYESFKELEYQTQKLIVLLNGISNRMVLSRIFDEDTERAIKKEVVGVKGTYIDDIISSVKDEQKNYILAKYASNDFRKLRSYMNILNLDFVYCDEELCVQPFTARSEESVQDLNIITQWLYREYRDVYESYVSSKKAFANGESVSCIMHCRNIIAGIFSSQKSEQRKWLDGLRKACHQDKNITNIQANKIAEMKYNENSSEENERYQYPRFKLIYRLYSFTCALGAHKNEGNMTADGVDNEVTNMDDALLALRMTEDVLIWFYKTSLV